MSVIDLPDDPITGICIVADPYKCPPRYNLIYRSSDRKDDCDLWKDGFFKVKVTRYICYTRSYTNESGRPSEVLVDIVVQNERDYPPPGYQLIERTNDTMDRATNKRQISVKMVERRLANEGVIDLVVINRSRQPPIGYNNAGEINGLLICFKLGSLTPVQHEEPTNGIILEQSSTGQTSNANGTEPMDYTSMTNDWFQVHSGAAVATSATASPTYNRQDSSLNNPMSGVPFQLNHKLVDTTTVLNSLREVRNGFTCKSLADIENEFSYIFTLERSATADDDNS